MALDAANANASINPNQAQPQGGLTGALGSIPSSAPQQDMSGFDSSGRYVGANMPNGGYNAFGNYLGDPAKQVIGTEPWNPNNYSAPKEPLVPMIPNFNQAYYQSPQYQSYLKNQPMVQTTDFTSLPFGGMGSGTTAGLQQRSYDEFLNSLNMAQPSPAPRAPTNNISYEGPVMRFGDDMRMFDLTNAGDAAMYNYLQSNPNKTPADYFAIKNQQTTTTNPLTPTGTPTGTPTMATNPLSQYANPTSTTGFTPAPDLGVTPGSASSGSFSQGSVLPNVTTTQKQVTAAPSFYTDYLNQLATQGQKAASGSQYVGAQPLQEQAFNQVAQNVGNYQPTLESAINLAGSVGKSNLAQAIGDVGQANIANYLAPQATAGLVGSGQFGSSRGARALGDTISNAELGITAQQAQAMQQDFQNRLLASQQLGNLAGQTQALGLGDINALSTLGGQQQTIKQNEQLFPMQQLTNMSQLLKGYTIPTSVSASQTAPGQQGQFAMSPLQSTATIATLLGALAQPGVSGTSAGKNIIDALKTGGTGLLDLISGKGGGNTQVSDSNTNVPAGSVRNSDGTYTGPNGENYNADGSIIVPDYVGSTQPSIDYGTTDGIDTSTM
jgi:hypothetical protein